MTPDAVFAACNSAALLAWILLAVTPRRQVVAGVVTGALVPLGFALVYAAVLLPRLGSSGGSFSTVDGVAALFADRWLLVAGWVHYLCFDLFLGSWQVRDAQRQGLPHLLVVPCLLLTFLFGPIGLGAYLALRLALRKRLSVAEAEAQAKG